MILNVAYLIHTHTHKHTYKMLTSKLHYFDLFWSCSTTSRTESCTTS